PPTLGAGVGGAGGGAAGGRLDGHLGGDARLVLVGLLGRRPGGGMRLGIERITDPEAVLGMLPLGDVIEDLGHLVGTNRLVVQQFGHHALHGVAVMGEDLFGLVVGGVDHLTDLAVDEGRHLVGVVLLTAVVATQEHLAVGTTVLHRSQLIRHAVFHHHLAGDRRRLLDVVGGAGGGVGIDDLFG